MHSAEARHRQAIRTTRKWATSIWMGFVARSNEVYVGTPEGVVRAWTIRRTGGHDRWKKEVALAVKGTSRIMRSLYVPCTGTP